MIPKIGPPTRLFLRGHGHGHGHEHGHEHGHGHGHPADLPGLSSASQQIVRGLVDNLRDEPHEFAFRRGVMTELYDQGFDAATRKAIMSRAVDFYRNSRRALGPSAGWPAASPREAGPVLPARPTRKSMLTIATSARTPEEKAADTAEEQELERAVGARAVGGRYHRRVEVDGKRKYFYSEDAYRRSGHAHVAGADAAVDMAMTASSNPSGYTAVVPVVDLARVHRPLVIKGADADAGVGVGNEDAAPGAAAGVSPKKLPPGTKRIWHNRIVQRGLDDKWHVVGHVAGLEDPSKVPELAHHELTDEERKTLLAKLQKLIAKKHALDTEIHAAIHAPKDASA